MSKRKTDSFYFNNFIETADIACQAAEMLKSVLINFDAGKLPEMRRQLHTIEHKGDEKRHAGQRAHKRLYHPIEAGRSMSSAITSTTLSTR